MSEKTDAERNAEIQVLVSELNRTIREAAAAGLEVAVATEFQFLTAGSWDRIKVTLRRRVS